MRILILFFLTFGILLAQEDLGLQEDIDVNYKRMVREKKKVIIPEIVGLKAEDQKKLFDRSSKTYVEFPILPGNKPSIVIKTPAGYLYNVNWRILSCYDLGETFDLKYVRIKKMQVITKVVSKTGKIEILREDDEKEFNSDDIDFMPLYADNNVNVSGSAAYGNAVKHFLIEIYIKDVFRKETGKLCVSEILPFDS
ncbi:hypothetical protein [Leptospira santarosai]|uniref:hypothetical protein n=2 Tax=Leptospira santarosai TaxID=28183 RepID=UPI0024AF06F0|nr:hypothetical protein [Leptospira santarosai]MDI7175211.1 hypothetical protein [Leptospira santarosai]MDI7194874.1 hypothetical protein [Leptospira santarosai]MDO6399264.1 hypothetical protein [Leptospira santarosai]MDO6404715.1 hypothetical protein [Leptospira santarosai]